MGSTYGDLFADWEIAVAKRVVAQFKANYPWLRGLDFDDLLQECLIHWYGNRNRYRTERGASPQGYMSRVLKHKLRSLLRRELADTRRMGHLAESLERTEGENETALGDMIAAPEVDSDIHLVLDLESAVAGLPPFQQRICHLLVQGYPVTDIAQILGKPRGTLRDQIEKIKRHFSQAGL